MPGRDRMGGQRRGGFVPPARLPLPPGAPRRLAVVARRCRVAEALGPELARSLSQIRERDGALELLFTGDGWETRLEPLRAEIERRVAAALGMRSARIRIASVPARAAGGREARAQPAPPAGLSPAERLRRVADRLRRRAVDTRGRRQ